MERVGTSYSTLPKVGMQYPPFSTSPEGYGSPYPSGPLRPLSSAMPVYSDPMRTPPHIHGLPLQSRGAGAVSESMMTGPCGSGMDVDPVVDMDDLTIAMRGLVEAKEPVRSTALFPLQCIVRSTWGEEKTAWLNNASELSSYLKHFAVDAVGQLTIKLPGMGEWDFNAESTEGKEFVAAIKSFFRNDDELSRKLALNFGYARD